MSVVFGNTEMTELLNCSKRRDTVQNPSLKIMKIAICPLNKGSSNSKSVWISCKHTSAGLGDVQHRYTKNLWSKQPSYWQLGNIVRERWSMASHFNIIIFFATDFYGFCRSDITYSLLKSMYYNCYWHLFRFTKYSLSIIKAISNFLTSSGH